MIPQALVDKEVAHCGLTEFIVVQTMHERKARMAATSRTPSSHFRAVQRPDPREQHAKK